MAGDKRGDLQARWMSESV